MLIVPRSGLLQAVYRNILFDWMYTIQVCIRKEYQYHTIENTVEMVEDMVEVRASHFIKSRILIQIDRFPLDSVIIQAFRLALGIMQRTIRSYWILASLPRTSISKYVRLAARQLNLNMRKGEKMKSNLALS